MANSALRIPQTKPATEFIDGRLVPKMSPYGLHARVQLVVASALGAWADEGGRGRVGTEWDYDLTPPGERTNRLVPDIAYLSYERVAYENEAAAQVPSVAPNVVVEILSEGQTLATSQRRVEIFLACTAELVVLIDPRAREAWLIDAASTQHLTENDVIAHAAIPAFSLSLRRCCELPQPKSHRT
jgi:Uma2 family endonuclease